MRMPCWPFTADAPGCCWSILLSLLTNSCVINGFVHEVQFSGWGIKSADCLWSSFGKLGFRNLNTLFGIIQKYLSINQKASFISTYYSSKYLFAHAWFLFFIQWEAPLTVTLKLDYICSLCVDSPPRAKWSLVIRVQVPDLRELVRHWHCSYKFSMSVSKPH